MLIGYVLGCFQTAYIVTRISIGKDIRQMGSGNAGTTNVTRSVGIKPALITFFADLIKTVLAVVICRLIFKDVNPVIVGTYAGAGVVLGHDYPVWLGFKGGKGVAVTLAWIFLADWRVGIVTFVLSLAVLLSTGYLALNAISLSSFFVVSMLFFKFIYTPASLFIPWDCIAVVAVMGAVMIIRHRQNFVRLKHHEEKKIYAIIAEKRKKKKE